MKLLICIVQDHDASNLMQDFIEHDFRVTKLSSTGGFLKSGNTTMIMGVKEERVEEALEVIKKNCNRRKHYAPVISSQMEAIYQGNVPVEIEIGGATVFELDVDKMYRL